MSSLLSQCFVRCWSVYKILSKKFEKSFFWKIILVINVCVYHEPGIMPTALPATLQLILILLRGDTVIITVLQRRKPNFVKLKNSSRSRG